MLDRLLHQKRFPWFTMLSILTTAQALAAVIAALSSSHSGFEGLGAAVLALIALAAGLVLNMIWGLLAYVRHEYRGGRIAAVGIVLPFATVFGWSYISGRQEVAAEHARTWSAIHDIFVQPDGKLLLVGTGLVRLLPDGRLDPSFHRDYSFGRGGGLPDPVHQAFDWPGACAAMAPNGDLLLAANGWIDRVRPDGSDGPNLLNRPGGGVCWGLAVQPDGKIVVGWDSHGTSPISRLLPDGSADPGFHAAFAATPGTDQGPWSSHPKIVILRDGRIVVAGPIQPLEGGCIRTLLRLNPDGNRDEGFRFKESCQPADFAEQRVPDVIAILPDESLLVSLHNTHHARNEMLYLDRDGEEVRKDGRRDELWRPDLTAAVPMSDGGILMDAGEWIVKIRPDGASDPAFHALHKYLSAHKVFLQGEKILIVDENGKLSRLNSDGSPDPSFHTPLLRVYAD